MRRKDYVIPEHLDALSFRIIKRLVDMTGQSDLDPECVARYSRKRLLREPGLGKRSVCEIEAWLEQYGLALEPDLSHDPNAPTLLPIKKCCTCGTALTSDTPANRRVVLRLLHAKYPTSCYDVAAKTYSPVHRVVSVLDALEKDGLVRAENDNFYLAGPHQPKRRKKRRK